ncbi:MAG TPA: VPA1262 family protein [Polyangia bacterium]|jgi:hypothetical protein|nr:VPA1262 family protein [Polyangia bacterium]
MKNVTNLNLVETLGRWSTDQRLSRLLAGTGRCSLSMWLLDLDTGGQKGVRLLYAWIIEAPKGAPDVTPANLSDWISLGENVGRFRLRRLVVNESATALRLLVRELLSGRTLGEAAAAIHFAPSIPDFCAGMRLGDSATNIAKVFSEAPVRFLPTGTAAALAGSAASMNSPSADQPMFVGALVRLDKPGLFKADSGTPLPGADDLARQCMTCLDSQTNLRFTGSDGGRLGNLEYLYAPAADCYESGDVSVDVERDISKEEVRVEAVSVSVRAGILPLKAPLLVRCRIFAGQEVANDTCVPLSVGETRLFPVDYEISGALVTIWRLEADGSASLWFENRIYLMRRLVMHMGVMGLSGSLDTDWTRGLSNLRAATKGRVDKVKSIQHVSYDRGAVIGGWTPWEAAEKDGSLLSQRLFPTVSEARFFPRGWDESGPGALSFIEWFRTLSDNAETSSIMIVDPFFERHGVEEILARVKATNVEYIVLTNAQATSKDDDPGNAGPLRATRIRESCERVSDFLAQIRFRVLDLRSKGGGRDQLFHDRYVLVFGSEGVLTRGYHLSNSIQGATRRDPLLVTPIPMDVLEKVGAYVANLMVGGGKEAEVIEIASTAALRAEAHMAQPKMLDAIANPGEFFASLFEDPALRQVPQSSVADWLTNAGAMNSESFALTDDLLKRTKTFVANLASAQAGSFSQTWETLSEYLARLSSGGSALIKALIEAGPALERRLAGYLRAAPSVVLSQGVRVSDKAIGLGHLLNRSFSSVLRDAGYLFDHHVSPLAIGGFAVHYAADVLREISPPSLIAVASEIWRELPESERGNFAVPQTRAASLIFWKCIGSILDGLHGIGFTDRIRVLTDHLLEADLPLLRALGAQKAIQIPVDGSPDVPLAALGRLPLAERLTALCEWISELRVLANRAEGREPEPVRSMRARILKHLSQVWPSDISPEDLRGLAIRMGGPGEGGWAESTTSDLLAILVENGKLSWESIETMWFSVLIEHLRPMLAGAGTQHHFYAPNDGALTRACVAALLRCAQPRREDRRQSLSSLCGDAARTLAIPFVRSRSFQKWFDVVEGLHWVLAFVQLLLSQAGASFGEEERAAWETGLKVVEEILEGLPEIEHGEARKFAISILSSPPST